MTASQTGKTTLPHLPDFSTLLLNRTVTPMLPPAAMNLSHLTAISFSPYEFIESIMNCLVNYVSGPNKAALEHFNQKMNGRVKKLDQALKQYQAVNQKIDLLNSRQPQNVEEWLAYEQDKQLILTEQRVRLTAVQTIAGHITDKTNEKHRDKYYEDKLINLTGLHRFERLHKDVSSWHKTTLAAKPELTKAQETNQHNQAYLKEFIEASHLEQEVATLVGTFFDSKTPEETRSTSQARLKDLQIVLENKLLRLDALSKVSSYKDQTDSIASREIWKQTFRQVDFYGQSIAQNIAELDLLYRAHSPEYLSCSFTYQSKLLAAKKYEEAIAFGNEWMRTLPQKASWTEIQTMANLLLKTVQKNHRPNLLSFSQHLSSWLQGHPELQLNNPIATTSENTQIAHQLELLQGALSHAGDDLGFKAAAHYRNCAALDPTQSLWKQMQVRFHLSANQWSEARRHLRTLPPEQTFVLRQEMAYRQYATHFLGVDLFKWGISDCLIPLTRAHFTPNQNRAFSHVNTFIQTATNPLIRSYWLPHCGVDEPEMLGGAHIPSGFKATLLAGQIATSVFLPQFFDFISANPQEREWYRSNHEQVASLALNGVSLVASLANLSGEAGSMFIPAFNTGASAASLAYAINAYMGNDLSPDWKAALLTVQKIADTLTPINILYSSAPVVGSVLKGASVQLGAEALFTQTASFISPPVLMTTVLIGVAGYRFFFDYQVLRANCTIEESISLCYQGKYEEAKRPLAEAQSWSIGDSQTAAHFADCIDFIKAAPNLKPDLASYNFFNSCCPILDKNWTGLKSSPHYERALNDLRFHTFVAYIRMEQFTPLKNWSTQESLTSDFYTRAAAFSIESAENLADQSLTSAENLLTNLEFLFRNTEHDQLVQKYKEYFVVRREIPNITKDTPAEEYIRRGTPLDQIRLLIKDKLVFSQVYKNLSYQAFHFVINYGWYANALHFLAELDGQYHAQYVSYLDQATDADCQAGRYDKAKERIQNLITHLPNHPRITTLQAYLNYVVVFQQTTQLAYSDLAQRELAINAVINSLSTEPLDKALNKKLVYRKLYLFLHSDQFKEAQFYIEKIRLSQPEQSQIIEVVFSKAIELYSKSKKAEAVALLANAHRELTGLSQRSILDKSRLVFSLADGPLSPSTTRREWLNALAALKAEIGSDKALDLIVESFSVHKFWTHINLEEFTEAASILAKEAIAPNHQLTALKIMLHKADELISQEKRTEAVAYLKKAYQALTNFSHKEIMLAYCDYISFDLSKELSNEEKQKWLGASAKLLEKIESIPELADLVNKIKSHKFQVYIKYGDYAAALSLRKETISNEAQAAAVQAIVNQSIKLINENKREEALTHLAKAHLALEGFVHRDLIIKYKDYLELQTNNQESSEKSKQLIEVINKLLDLLNPPEIFKNQIAELQNVKFQSCIALEDFPAANSLLATNELSAESQTIAIFYILAKGQQLFDATTVPIAIDYLLKAYDGLPEFAHRETILLYRTFLSNVRNRVTTSKEIDDWIAHIDPMIIAIQKIPFLAGLHFRLLKEKFNFCVNYQRYEEAKRILDALGSIPQKNTLINSLVSQLLSLGIETRPNNEIPKLARELGITKHKVMSRYLKMIEILQIDPSIEQDPTKIEEYIHSYNSFEEALQSSQIPFPIWMSSATVNLYVALRQLEASRKNKSAALAANQQGIDYLLKRGITRENQTTYDSLRAFKERFSYNI